MTRQRPRVLIVEDDKYTSAMFGLLLGTLGLDYVAANSVSEAIERLSIIFDLIVLDLMLPDGDGIEVLQAIRDRKILVPVIVSTAKDVKDGADQWLEWTKPLRELQPDQFLVKPVAFGVIKAIAQDICDKFRAAPPMVDHQVD